MTTECNCPICEHHKYVLSVIETRDVDKLIHLVNELENRLACAEADVSYYTAILDGSWPTAVEHLEKSLLRAKDSLAANASHGERR